MTASENRTADAATRLAATVRSHPSVTELHGGRLGVIATPLPGRKIVGVRIGADAEATEIGVALRLDRPLPEVVGELRVRAREVLGAVPVNITVADVSTPDEREPDEREPDARESENDEYRHER
ncbi:hypothetical protein [Parasphingorhabdus pacifica]